VHVELSDEVVKEAEERAMPRAAVVFETIRREGEGELNRTLPALMRHEHQSYPDASCPGHDLRISVTCAASGT
jgi:hypothetical protein